MNRSAMNLSTRAIWPFAKTLGRVALVFLTAAQAPSWALSSDKQQPTEINSDKMTYSETAQVNQFSGNVVLTRGSLEIRGNQLTLTQRPDGTQLAEVRGQPARFKQQRDSDTEDKLFIQGQGNLIVFDGQLDTILLKGRAGIRKLTNEIVTEQITGESIQYNQGSEFLTVDGGSQPNGAPNRVQAIIKPVQSQPEQSDQTP